MITINLNEPDHIILDTARDVLASGAVDVERAREAMAANRDSDARFVLEGFILVRRRLHASPALTWRWLGGGRPLQLAITTPPAESGEITEYLSRHADMIPRGNAERASFPASLARRLLVAPGPGVPDLDDCRPRGGER